MKSIRWLGLVWFFSLLLAGAVICMFFFFGNGRPQCTVKKWAWREKSFVQRVFQPNVDFSHLSFEETAEEKTRCVYQKLFVNKRKKNQITIESQYNKMYMLARGKKL